MSKAVGSILLIGAAIAINVIPGAGQVISGSLGALFSGTAIGGGVTAAGFAAAQAVYGALSVGLTVAGIQAAGSLLAGTPPAGRAETTESARKSPIPARTRAYGRLRLYGDWILFGYKSDGTPVDVWAFHDGRMNAVEQVYLNDDKITISGGVVQQMADGRYRDNRVLCGYNIGLPTETAFAAVSAALPGIWTADHRGDGVVTGYVIKQLTKSEKFLETYPNGDDIQMSLAGEWSLVFDFRDPAQDAYDPSTWAYRDNAVLAFLHYQLTQNGKDFATHIEPQLASWTAAANDCDVAMTLSAGGTEPRYRIALAYKATATPASVISALLVPFDGWYCENERGELIVYSGRYYTPTVNIGPGQIVAYTLQEHVAAEDAINEVQATYVSDEHDFATVDAQAWRNEEAIAASGREPVSSTLETQAPSQTQARRLAKRKFIRANAQFRGSVTTTYGGRIALGQRYIRLRIEEAGTVFYDGPAEITGSPERDMQTGGLRFDWVAATAVIDAWNPAIEDGSSPPNGGLPDIEPVSTPEITDAEVTTADFGAQVTLEVDAPTRSDLTWSLRWKLHSDSAWTPASVVDSDPGPDVTIVYGYLPLSSEIDIQVSYATGDGRSSDWSATETVDTTPAP